MLFRSLSVICNNGKVVDVPVNNLISQIFKDVVSVSRSNRSAQGVGDTKSEYIGLELAPHEIEIMRDLKRMFDPKSIMNPGKTFGNSSVHRNTHYK